MAVKLLTKQIFQLLILKVSCTGSSESTLVKCHMVGNDMSRLIKFFFSLQHKAPSIQTVVHLINTDLDLVMFKIVLTLNAPSASKVVCFSRLLKCLRGLNGKQCGSRSDSSYRSRLFWVHAVCFYT